MKRTLVTLALGTVLGLGAVTHAATGGGMPWSSSGTLLAQADPPPPPRRPAPAATPPKAPPAPPASPVISGIQPLVDAKLAEAKARIKNDPNIPKDLRDKILAKLDKTQTIVNKRLSNLKLSDMDDFEEQMEKMGEEIEKEMEGFEDEMEKFAEMMAKTHGVHVDLDLDFDDIHNTPMAPDVDIDQDDDDLREAISDLKDLAVKPAQRDAIVKLRTDSDKTVADAKKKLDDLSTKLQTALGNSATSDAEIGKLVDQVSAQEAVIRKARIVAWAQARRVLDENQRKKVEAAAPKKK